MTEDQGYPRKETAELYRAILRIKTQEETVAFFRDLLTLPEIEDFSQRFQIAKMLFQGKSYADTANKLNVSTTTVSRVAHWLFRGRGGYKTILTRLANKKP